MTGALQILTPAARHLDVRSIIYHFYCQIRSGSGRLRLGPVLSGLIQDRVPGDESRDHRDAPREGKNANIPKGVMYELKRLYYECAHATYPVSLGALLNFDRLLFGTDYPAEPIESTLRELEATGLSPELLRAMELTNAERLFPRFKA